MHRIKNKTEQLLSYAFEIYRKEKTEKYKETMLGINDDVDNDELNTNVSVNVNAAHVQLRISRLSMSMAISLMSFFSH